MQNVQNKIKFLVVDDNDSFRIRLMLGLEDRGFEVYEAEHIDKAKQALKSEPIEYAIVDLKMPGGTGLDLLTFIKEQELKTKVLLLTGYGSIATATKAIHLGAVNYLQKPVDIDDILRALDKRFWDQLPNVDDIDTPSLDQIEWEHIQRVLGDCSGNITRAAQRMGMHRRTLQRKLKKHAPTKMNIG